MLASITKLLQSESIVTSNLLAKGVNALMISCMTREIFTSAIVSVASFVSNFEIIKMSLIRFVILSVSFSIRLKKSACILSSFANPFCNNSVYPFTDVIGVFNSWEALLKNSCRTFFSTSSFSTYLVTLSAIFSAASTIKFNSLYLLFTE